MNIEVLDPRYDPEPPYWSRLRKRAGLRADWSWDVLAVQAWCGRTPLLVTVLHEPGEIAAVACATWLGLPVRRNGFVPAGRAHWLGGLHVHAPGTGSTPGHWSGELPLRELLSHYTKAMRRHLGPGCRGLLLRQLTRADLPELAAHPRLIRPTEPLARIRVAWPDRDGWVATLSRNRRKNLRKAFRAVDGDPTIRLTIGPGAGADPVRIAALLRHNERKYRQLLGPLPQTTGYLTELLRQPDTLLLRYTAGEQLLAVVTILDHPEWPIARHWSALPVEQGGRPNLYFHYYGAILDWAARSGRRGVILGRGMPDLKRSLGADLIDQFAAAFPIW